MLLCPERASFTRLELLYPTISLPVKPHGQPSPKPSLAHQQESEAKATAGSTVHWQILRKAWVSTSKMINAVLVFNNAGQPRLTKFYTQLVHVLP